MQVWNHVMVVLYFMSTLLVFDVMPTRPVLICCFNRGLNGSSDHFRRNIFVVDILATFRDEMFLLTAPSSISFEHSCPVKFVTNCFGEHARAFCRCDITLLVASPQISYSFIEQVSCWMLGNGECGVRCAHETESNYFFSIKTIWDINPIGYVGVAAMFTQRISYRHTVIILRCYLPINTPRRLIFSPLR